MENIFHQQHQRDVITASHEGLRVDNYLMKRWNNVPRAHIYQLLRKRKVCVNNKRCEPSYRLQLDDAVDFYVLPNDNHVEKVSRPAKSIQLPILHEDNYLLAIDKPANIAVHGGSGVDHGIIERLRNDYNDIELIHRLDKGTSGVLLLSKKRSALRKVQEQWRDREVKKEYVALVQGQWNPATKLIDLPLQIIRSRDGSRRSIVADDGKPSQTRVRLIEQFSQTALVSANIITGRMHQLRVHFAHHQMPIVGDDKYGDFEINRQYTRAGFARLFLHAQSLSFNHPHLNKIISIESPVPLLFNAAAQWQQHEYD